MLPDAPIAVQTMRPFTEQIQTLLGAEQRKVHAVSVTEDVIAGVPVRRIARASGEVDRLRGVAQSAWRRLGNGFRARSTENILVAALSGLEVVAVLYRFAPEHPFPAAVDDALAVYQALLADHDLRDIGVYGTLPAP